MLRARSDMMLQLPHLLQAGQAEIPIQFVDEIPHDRIPFGAMTGRYPGIVSGRLRGVRKMTSSKGSGVAIPAGFEPATRGAGTNRAPCRRAISSSQSALSCRDWCAAHARSRSRRCSSRVRRSGAVDVLLPDPRVALAFVVDVGHRDAAFAATCSDKASIKSD